MLLDLFAMSHSADDLRAHNDRLNHAASLGALVASAASAACAACAACAAGRRARPKPASAQPNPAAAAGLVAR